MSKGMTFECNTRRPLKIIYTLKEGWWSERLNSIPITLVERHFKFLFLVSER